MYSRLKINRICTWMLLATLAVLQTITPVEAAESVNTIESETKNSDLERILKKATIVDSDIDILEKYGNQNGVYAIFPKSGEIIVLELNTSKIKVLSGVKEITQTNKMTVYTKQGTIDFISTIDGTFRYDGTHAWCISGKAYKKFSSSSSKISYTKNSFSDKKVTGYSKYEIKANVHTPYNNFSFGQYVRYNPSGKRDGNFYRV